MIATIIVFVVILGFLVLVHELGHFFAAKRSGIGVEEFGLGFPPKIASKTVKGTKYSINWIPLGGFVKIKGEDGESPQEEDSFGAKPIYKRLIVIIAGVGMNIAAGWFLLVVLFMAGAPIELTDDIDEKYIKDKYVVVAEVLEDTPADRAGLAVGDVLLGVNGENIETIDEFQYRISDKEGIQSSISYKRSKQEHTAEVFPEILEAVDLERAVIGVGLTEVGKVRFGPYKAVLFGTEATYAYTNRLLRVFGGIIASVFKGQGVGASIGGPVAIAVRTGDAVDLGLAHVIIFTAILSFNLAIINILPFPALDGGRLIFLAVEAVRGKSSKQEVEAWFHRIGFILLMVLAIFITYRDIVRFGGRIWQAVLG